TPQVPSTITTVTSPAPVPAPYPVSTSLSPDLFHSPPAQPPQPAVPVIAYGAPASPPPGYTSGTVCHNGICQLSPIPVHPAAPRAATTATPVYPSGSTFPGTVAPPQGVNVDVKPTGRPSDLSQVRQGVLGALPSKP